MTSNDTCVPQTQWNCQLWGEIPETPECGRVSVFKSWLVTRFFFCRQHHPELGHSQCKMKYLHLESTIAIPALKSNWPIKSSSFGQFPTKVNGKIIVSFLFGPSISNSITASYLHTVSEMGRRIINPNRNKLSIQLNSVLWQNGIILEPGSANLEKDGNQGILM